jgi:urea transport system ATP-binding protein
MNRLEISGLNFSYDGSRILRDVNLQVPPNKVVCLMGRNGVGKSTTLKNIVGLLTPENGEIRLDGKVIGNKSADARARDGLGFVPQGRDIFPHLTVKENLMVGIYARGNSPKSEDLDLVYELFPMLKEMMGRKGGVLSGGQQQQLAIGRALLTHPKLLILDEPTEGIQPSIIDQIGDTIKRLRNVEQEIAKAEAEMQEISTALRKLKKMGGISVLLVEQYLDFARELADIFYIMERGSIVAHGPIENLTEETVKQYLIV